MDTKDTNTKNKSRGDPETAPTAVVIQVTDPVTRDPIAVIISAIAKVSISTSKKI